ncbi:L-sorbosone dehydrogenase (modular protein) [Candidatus Filomicrobium marinum]|uniref:L-sorbosone dehydrogenase (Modular protein) n=2 Tax=Candidatus Filomicrobium marinum TaxID=1608628 RepID=A0A0D6JBX3_9HYPH|nr:L-sorbosone dehydrogenase (modular protein) [Candidatus Filomicrobium marinum]CPR16104.1 L-sorbosone dehydrogenase (modular protein) [Candidatus Filomicrobium marinum]
MEHHNRHSVYTRIIPFPIACFILTLLTDLAYWQTSNLMWQNFSSWLLFAGLVVGGVAALLGLVELAVRPELRAPASRWWTHASGGLLVLAAAFVNSLVHAGDGWTAVVPYGLLLSAVTVLLIAFFMWKDLTDPVTNSPARLPMSGRAMTIGVVTVLTLGLIGIAISGSFDSGSKFDVAEQIGRDPKLPEPQSDLIADLKVAEVVGWGKGETPTVAEGLTITPYARDLANPRTVHTLPNGDVLIVQSRGPAAEHVARPKDVIRDWVMSMAHGPSNQKKSNLITLLRDTDRDGKVDQQSDLITDLNSPFGVAWSEGTLYVAATDAILAYPYELGATQITAEPTVLTPLPGGPINHHWTKDLALSPDGRFLYASVGSNSNVAENGLEAEKGRAAIWRVDRQTGASRVFASGLRNPNGLSFQPETGTLWTVVNERDELGPNLVPDYMTSVQESAFYGWPWSYFGDHVDERVHPQRPDMVKKALKPDYALSSHVAALGLAFSANSGMPAPYANGAFVGLHGSWNRQSFNGYKVVFIPFENGNPAGKFQDVVTGFLDGDQVRGRPVGVGIDGTGALLIADDAGNTVWRVAAADGSVIPSPIGTDQVRSDLSTLGAISPEPTSGNSNSQAAALNNRQHSASPPKMVERTSPTDLAPAVLPEGSLQDEKDNTK